MGVAVPKVELMSAMAMSYPLIYSVIQHSHLVRCKEDERSSAQWCSDSNRWTAVVDERCLSSYDHHHRHMDIEKHCRTISNPNMYNYLYLALLH